MNSRIVVGVMMPVALASSLIAQEPSGRRPSAKAPNLLVKLNDPATVGTVQLLDGWTQKSTTSKDSSTGQIASGNGRLIVNYDIGGNAGTRMSDQRISACKCIWYKEQSIRGHLARIGLVETKAGRELAITIFDTIQGFGWKYPANFWATVQGDEDVADTLLIALSYEAAP